MVLFKLKRKELDLLIAEWAQEKQWMTWWDKLLWQDFEKSVGMLLLSQWFINTNIYLLLQYWSIHGIIDSNLPTCGRNLCQGKWKGKSHLLFSQKQLLSAQMQNDIPWLFPFRLSLLADNLKEMVFSFTQTSPNALSLDLPSKAYRAGKSSKISFHTVK